MTKLTLSIFVEWLFYSVDGDDAYTPVLFNDETKNMLVSSSIEWRKELATKGKGDMSLKQKAIDWIHYMIKHNFRYKTLFKCHEFFVEDSSIPKWLRYKDRMIYSLFLQPFIISPMINISDICVAWFQFTQGAHLDMDKINDSLLYRVICVSHPFPILERYIEKGLWIEDKCVIPQNTQVFIELDKMSSQLMDQSLSIVKKYEAFTFGLGKRKCGGISYALSMMIPFFQELESCRDVIRATKNHKYSGRHNDNESDINIFVYQVLLFIKCTYKLILLHRKTEILVSVILLLVLYMMFFTFMY